MKIANVLLFLLPFTWIGIITGRGHQVELKGNVPEPNHDKAVSDPDFMVRHNDILSASVFEVVTHLFFL